MNCLSISKKSNQIRIWTAVDRNRLRFAAFEIGHASSEIFRKFWNKIIKTNDIEMSCTDGNSSYAEVFQEDADFKHIVTEAETCLVESYNSDFPYYLEFAK